MLTIEESKQFDSLLREYCDISDRVVMDFVLEARNDEKLSSKLTTHIDAMVKGSLVQLGNIGSNKMSTSKLLDEDIRNMQSMIERAEANGIVVKNADLFDHFRSLYNTYKNSNPIGVYFRMWAYLMFTCISMIIAMSVLYVASIPVAVGRLVAFVKLGFSLIEKLFKIVSRKSTAPVSEASVLIGVPLAIGIFTQLVPFLKEGLYFIFYMDVKLSDSLKAIGDGVEMNILKLKADKEKDPKKKAAIIKKQESIANTLQKLGNKLNFVEINSKKAKKAAKEDKVDKIDREIIKELKNVDPDGVISI